MNRKYRKKPVVIEAFQWTGDHNQKYPVWAVEAINVGTIYYQGGLAPYMTIETLEGKMGVSIGDWIIQGVMGEIYPCRPAIFEATYEEVTADASEQEPS